MFTLKKKKIKLKPIKAKRTKSKIRELFKSIEALEGNPTRFVDI